MTAPERQKLFKTTIQKMEKSAQFAKAMEREPISRATALSLFQLADAAKADALTLLNELGGDTTPKII